jgi:hypothetical protein
MMWALSKPTARRSTRQGRFCGGVPISNEPPPQQ